MNYEGAEGMLPRGANLGEGSMWSAFILPFMEDESLWDLLTIGEGSRKGGGSSKVNQAHNYQWAQPGPYSHPITNITYRNIIACETLIPTFRCPSAGLPEYQYDVSSDNWHVIRRVPGSYLGNATGLLVDQNQPNRGLANADGVLVGHQHTSTEDGIKLRQVSDGTSKTLLLGEAQHNVTAQVDIGQKKELAVGDHKDHWYVGGDDPDIYNDVSEGLGSTAVPINLHKKYDSCFDRSARYQGCQALQLSYSSSHSGIVQIALCDGSVQSIEQGIDPLVWSSMGTRSGQTLDDATTGN
jgi:hypothetical protein